jgi:peptidyl-prolyl cis-trans isomerase D
MLESMRQNLKSLQIFLWLVIAAFIGTIFLVWGQGGRQGSAGSQNAIAWVNDQPIARTTFEQSYRNIYGMYKQVYGDRLTNDVLENLQLEQLALNQLTRKMLLAQEAKRYELQVADAELVERIQSIPQFQRNGQFDPETYQRLLSRVRLTPQEFEAQTRQDLLVAKLEHLIKQTVRVSDQEVLAEYRLQNEKVRVEGLLLKPEQFESEVNVTDEDISAYYDAHKENFRTPQRIKIRYLHFDPQTLKDEVTLSEEEIRAYYDAHQEEFDKGKEVRARHILFRVSPDADEETEAEVKAKAQDVLQQIQEGADFAAMAREHSEDTASAKNGGDLGFFAKGMMVPEFEEAAFSLTPGEVSDLVRTQFGYHIVQVEETREEEDPYGKAKPVITDRLKLQQAQTLAADRAEAGYELLLDRDDLTQVADEIGLDVQTSQFFGRGEPIDDDIGVVRQVQEIAFTLTPEEKFSQPIETPQGYFLVEWLDLKEPYIPELNEIRDDVAAAVRQEQARERAKAEAQKIAAALQDGTSWEDVLEQYPVEEITPDPFNRRQEYISAIQASSKDLVQTAFALQEGEYSEVIELAQAYCIIRKVDTLEPDMEAFEQKRDTLAQQLRQQRRNTVFQEFVEELKQNAEIRVSPLLQT